MFPDALPFSSNGWTPNFVALTENSVTLIYLCIQDYVECVNCSSKELGELNGVLKSGKQTSRIDGSLGRFAHIGKSSSPVPRVETINEFHFVHQMLRKLHEANAFEQTAFFKARDRLSSLSLRDYSDRRQ